MSKYIKTVSADHFKGRSFRYNLEPLTAIIGANMTGKSAVVDALRVALLGYSPRHGKQPKATWGFAGARDGTTIMKLAADFVDHPGVAHSFEVRKGKVSLDSVGGPFPMVPPVLMDVRNEFLAKSGPDKVRFIFDQIDLEAMGFTTEKVTARLKAGVKVDEPTESSEAALTSIVEDVEALAQERDELHRTTQEWLTSVATRIKDDMTDAQAVVNDMEGLIQGMTQLRSQEGLSALGDVEGELTRARAALQQAVTTKQVEEKRATEYVRRSTLRENLKVELQGADEAAGKLAEAEKEYAHQLTKLQAFQSRTVKLTMSVHQGERAVSLAALTFDRLTRQIAAAREKLVKDLKADACPHCKSTGDHWKASLKESVEAEIAAMDKEAKDFESQRAKADEFLRPMVEQLKLARAEDEEIDQLRAMNYSLANNIKELRSRTDRFISARATLATLQDIGEAVPEAKLAALRATVATEQGRVRDLEDKDRQRVAGMQDAKRAEEARQKHADKKVQIEVRKLALKVLDALRVEMMTAAYTGFMDKVNLFGAGIMPGKLEYRDGEIGYFAGATWVALDYFSGTEEMLTLIGLSVALTQASPFKIVFVDEWLRDAKLRVAVAGRLGELIQQGVIHQAIIVDTESDGYRTINGCAVVTVQ